MSDLIRKPRDGKRLTAGAIKSSNFLRAALGFSTPKRRPQVHSLPSLPSKKGASPKRTVIFQGQIMSAAGGDLAPVGFRADAGRRAEPKGKVGLANRSLRIPTPGPQASVSLQRCGMSPTR